MLNVTEEEGAPFIMQILHFIWDLGLALLVVYLIITFVIQNTKVSGSSMEPTLHHHDAVIINKWIYYLKDPQQGDIIIFPYQGDPSKKYIKRIIALPGDLLDIQEGNIYINGKKLEESYITESWIVKGNVVYPFSVPDDHYFVMGDHRDHSADSRFEEVGTVKKNQIIGKAWVRIWPLKQFKIF